jgi:hypothetical protein
VALETPSLESHHIEYSAVEALCVRRALFTRL